MKKSKKKFKLRNFIINCAVFLLFLVALALIFNSSIRNMIMVWHTNQYQVSKVSKEEIKQNKAVESSFEFSEVRFQKRKLRKIKLLLEILILTL